MVYTNRTEKYMTSQEPNAAAKNSATGSKYQTSFDQNSSSSTNSARVAANNSWSKNASEPEKWKYNNMVRDERSKFNSMHFS